MTKTGEQRHVPIKALKEENKLRYKYAIALMLAAILVVPLVLTPVSANHVSIDISRVRKYGPQFNNVIQVQTALGSTGPMWDRLAAGTIDVGEWPITRTQLNAYINDYIQTDIDSDGIGDCRDTVTGAVTFAKYRPGTDPVHGAVCLITNNEFGMFVLDINHFRPLGSNVHFRRAMAHLNDIGNLVTNICLGLCTDLSGIPLPNPAMADWRNTAAAGAFPKFSPSAAFAELQLGGFIDVDSDGILEYDLNGDGTVAATEEPTIVHYSRLDVNRNGYGRALKNKYAFDNPAGDPDNIRALFGAGFRYDLKEVTFATVFRDIFDPACSGRQHDLYQGGWGTGISPDLLFFLYHSLFLGPGLPNYNCMNIPALDAALEAMFSAPDAATALANTLAAQQLWADLVPNIGLWSFASRLGYRAVLKDVVNFLGGGEDSFLSFLTMGFRRGLDARPWTARYNAINPPESLNIVYSSDFWGGNVLAQVYEGLITINPNKPTILGNEGIMPWLAKTWTLGTYTGTITGVNWNGAPVTFTCATVCDKITFKLDTKHPILFHDGTQMTSADIKFSIEYGRDSIPYGGWQGQSVFDVVLVNTPTAFTAEIFYDARSFFHLINAGISIYPKASWQSVPFATPPTVIETAPALPLQGAVTGQVATGPYRLLNWDVAAGTVTLERFAGYHRSSAVYDRFHASGNVNGLSHDMVDHLRTVHGFTTLPPYSILSDNSNRVDVLDLVIIGGNFNKLASAAPKADLNEDGVINILDLVRVGGNMFKDFDHGEWTTFPSPAAHPIGYA